MLVLCNKDCLKRGQQVCPESSKLHSMVSGTLRIKADSTVCKKNAEPCVAAVSPEGLTVVVATRGYNYKVVEVSKTDGKVTKNR